MCRANALIVLEDYAAAEDALVQTLSYDASNSSAKVLVLAPLWVAFRIASLHRAAAHCYHRCEAALLGRAHCCCCWPMRARLLHAFQRPSPSTMGASISSMHDRRTRCTSSSSTQQLGH